MPGQSVWEQFFRPDEILDALALPPDCRQVLEYGCGYGTFTVPAAKRVSGQIHALDLDQSMLAMAKMAANKSGVRNITFNERDFVAAGSGLPDQSVDYAMAFNILHLADPVSFLIEAHRNLIDGGQLAILHWIHDPETPRGPPLAIRPTPAQCKDWAEIAGFVVASDVIDLPPYHYGLVMKRRSAGPSLLPDTT